MGIIILPALPRGCDALFEKLIIDLFLLGGQQADTDERMRIDISDPDKMPFGILYFDHCTRFVILQITFDLIAEDPKMAVLDTAVLTGFKFNNVH